MRGGVPGGADGGGGGEPGHLPVQVHRQHAQATRHGQRLPGKASTVLRGQGHKIFKVLFSSDNFCYVT